ncbi:MAG: hypothetical protein J6M53_02995 [Bacteroidaceae bacterium]|nr:hypothetical protein [Bacteroidaceae bacterium]
MSQKDLSNPTIDQLRSVLLQATQHFPASEDALPVTDLAIQLKPENGEVCVFDDNDNCVASGVIGEWVGDTREGFYDAAILMLQRAINSLREEIEAMGILQPFSIVLQDYEHETVADLYVVDSDRIVLDGELLSGLDQDLETFWENLMER